MNDFNNIDKKAANWYKKKANRRASSEETSM